MSLQRCEGTSVEEVLASVRARWGEEATIVEANRLRKGGIAGFFARERFEVVVDLAGEADNEDSHDDSEWTAQPDPEGGLTAPAMNLEDHLLGLADSVSDTESHRPSTEQSDFSAVLESLSHQLRDQDPPVTLAASPVSYDSPAPGLARTALHRLSAPSSPSVDVVLRLGFPEELARRGGPSTETDPARWLAGLLEHVPLPGSLPRCRGSVLAVVGDRQAALDLGRDLAASMRIDANMLVLASPDYRGEAVPDYRRIDAAELAAEQRRSWRRRTGPTVVSVESPCGRDPSWARRLLDALEPTMIWAAIDAHRKPEDIVDWAERLGGVDALSVTGLDDTVSPGSILRCGIPVGRIDGRPASPALWAALLAPRLVNPSC